MLERVNVLPPGGARRVRLTDFPDTWSINAPKPSLFQYDSVFNFQFDLCRYCILEFIGLRGAAMMSQIKDFSPELLPD